MSPSTDRSTSPWFEAQVEKECGKDVLPRTERNAQPLVLIGTLIAVLFVAAHQLTPTGFFTDDFGALASFLMYGMLFVGAIPPVVRFVTGRRNPARLIESTGMIFSVVAMVYFLAKFPFDFSHFADPLPNSIEFLIDWVSGGLAKILLGLAIFVSSVMCLYGFGMYFAVKCRLGMQPGPCADEPVEEQPEPELESE